jgi:hypothetical protein
MVSRLLPLGLVLAAVGLKTTTAHRAQPASMASDWQAELRLCLFVAL